MPVMDTSSSQPGVNSWDSSAYFFLVLFSALIVSSYARDILSYLSALTAYLHSVICVVVKPLNFKQGYHNELGIRAPNSQHT